MTPRTFAAPLGVRRPFLSHGKMTEEDGGEIGTVDGVAFDAAARHGLQKKIRGHPCRCVAV